jgi:hypothetical protein
MIDVNTGFVLFFGTIFYGLAFVALRWLFKIKFNKWLPIAAEALHKIECEKCRRRELNERITQGCYGVDDGTETDSDEPRHDRDS